MGRRLRDATTWTLILGIWSAVGLFLTLVYARLFAPLELTMGEVVLRGFGDAYLWAAVTAVAVVITRRFPIGQGPGRRTILIHLVAAVLLPSIRLVLYAGAWELGREFGLHAPRGIFHPFYLAENYVVYLAMLGVVHAVYYSQRFRDRQVAAHRLEAELSSAQLHILKTQLHPHFLFNTLNGISSLMYSDVRAADRMLTQLAELLRHSLSAFHAHKVTLQRELDFLRPYLQIEQARLGDRLTVEMEIAPGLELALVPHLILQPLAENAVRHGISTRPAGGCLQVRVVDRDERLCLEVSDDGPGSGQPSPSAGQGVGLSNTRARLANLYGEDHEFRIEDGPEGFTVYIELPLEFAPETVKDPISP